VAHVVLQGFLTAGEGEGFGEGVAFLAFFLAVEDLELNSTGIYLAHRLLILS
jgi:hypothetical protein